MRIISVSRLRGNEILGKQIYDEAGRILLNVGVKLTPVYIKKLKELGIMSIYIEDHLSKGIVIEETISNKTRQLSKHVLKEVVDKYSREGKTDSTGIMKSVNDIVEEVLSSKEVLVNIEEIRISSNNAYSHAVNVCVLATLIGTHMGFNKLKLKDIALGAILHDIGKAKIWNDKKLRESFKSEDELNNYIEIMHPKVGYDFLNETNFCSAYAKVIVLMHHEKIDGSGYPLKLRGNEINELAKLVSVCDVFDNMVSGKENEKPMPAYEVIEYIIGMSGYSFDLNIVQKFTANIAAFPTSTGVMLNTKAKCLVIRQNYSMPLRPVVRVIYDQQGNIVNEPYEIDLMSELTLFIISACEV